jgi:hypothetical protein
MTKDELDKEIEMTLAQNRAVIERIDATLRKSGPLIPKHMESTDRLLRELWEAAGRQR